MVCRGLVFLPLCLVLLLTAGIAQSGDKSEQAKLEGTWTLVKKSGGKEKPDGKEIKATFKGDKMTLKGGDKMIETTYTVDLSKKPHTMDLTIQMGDKKATLLSIYEVKGDTMKVCHYDMPKALKERPKAFAASEDCVIAEFKRDKK